MKRTLSRIDALLVATFVVVTLSLATLAAAQPPRDKPNQPSGNAATTVNATPEASKDIVLHIKTMFEGKEGWEQSQKTLEQKYGALALAPLMTAREFSSNTEFVTRCNSSIRQIELNIKNGLSGGRTFDKPEKPEKPE